MSQLLPNPLKGCKKAAARCSASSRSTSSNEKNASAADKRWAQLQDLEARRRAIHKRVEEPFWKMLLHWDGTVFRQITRDALFYITIGLYVGIRVHARQESLPSYVDDLGNGQIALLGSFLTFFLVFWVNQNHKRYFGLYEQSMKCKGRIFDVATLAASRMNADPTQMPKEVAYRLVRYMNAAHAAGYVGLSQVYPSDSYFAKVNASCRLLTDVELERMNAINLDKGGSCNRELLTWCTSEIDKLKIRCPRLDNEFVNLLHTQVLALRAAIGQLYNAADLPVPFFYVHFISVLTVLYLPLFAVSTGYKAGTGNEVHWTADVIAGLVVVLQSLFVIGLRVVGQKMSDPYGDDLVDLSVVHFVDFTWTQSQRVLESKFPQPDASWEEELELIRERDGTKPIGAAWMEPTEPSTNSTSSFRESESGLASSRTTTLVEPSTTSSSSLS